MNSTSSTEVPSFAKAPSSATAPEGRGALRPWQFFLTASFIGAAVVVWLAPPASPVALLFVSFAVFAAGACAVALHGLLTALAGKSPPEMAITATVREALEREKLLTLRALKDLEFDKAMGKVSDADAASMERRLRERAMAIMRDLDGRASVRARVEEDVARRQATGHRPPASANAAAGRQATGVCQCGTANDADARFCKSCGSKL